MPRDIREILNEEQSNSLKLSNDHRKKFDERLAELDHPKRKNYQFLKIAASIIIILSLGYFFVPKNTIEQPVDDTKIVNIGNVSPEMKQIENYYLTAINYEMASIEQTPENKDILDAYLKKIAELTSQYKQLSLDLTEKEINEKTINALIDNLQLRLQILLELRDTLNEMKTPKTITNEITI